MDQNGKQNSQEAGDSRAEYNINKRALSFAADEEQLTDAASFR
jgi:hypothetical protein